MLTKFPLVNVIHITITKQQKAIPFLKLTVVVSSANTSTTTLSVKLVNNKV